MAEAGPTSPADTALGVGAGAGTAAGVGTAVGVDNTGVGAVAGEVTNDEEDDAAGGEAAGQQDGEDLK